MFQVYPCIGTSFFSMAEYVSGMNIPGFVHPFMSRCTFGLFPLFLDAIINNAAINLCIEAFVKTYVLASCGWTPRSKIPGPYDLLYL